MAVGRQGLWRLLNGTH